MNVQGGTQRQPRACLPPIIKPPNSLLEGTLFSPENLETGRLSLQPSDQPNAAL